jgi:hypothetical protein
MFSSAVHSSLLVPWLCHPILEDRDDKSLAQGYKVSSLIGGQGKYIPLLWLHGLGFGDEVEVGVW